MADVPAVAPQKVVKKRDYVLDDGTLVGPPSSWTILAMRVGATLASFGQCLGEKMLSVLSCDCAGPCRARRRVCTHQFIHGR
jgi:hypothetical protein